MDAISTEGEHVGIRRRPRLPPERGVVMSSQNLLIVIFLVALAVAMIGWRTMLVMTLTAGATLAVLGLVEIVSLLGAAT